MIEKICAMLEVRRLEYEKASESVGLELPQETYYKGIMRGYEYSKNVVQEVAMDGGWIPCSERLPEHMQQCLTTARIYYVPDHVDEPDNYIGVELNTYSKNFGWLYNPEVIAWQPLPEPYQKGE